MFLSRGGRIHTHHGASCQRSALLDCRQIPCVCCFVLLLSSMVSTENDRPQSCPITTECWCGPVGPSLRPNCTVAVLPEPPPTKRSPTVQGSRSGQLVCAPSGPLELPSAATGTLADHLPTDLIPPPLGTHPSTSPSTNSSIHPVPSSPPLHSIFFLLAVVTPERHPSKPTLFYHLDSLLPSPS